MGLIHCCCGDGKGKTTSALGLALRFAGAGGRVYIVQFLKGAESGELKILDQLDGITVLRNEKDLGFVFQMTEEQKAQCRKMHNENLDKALASVRSGQCGMLILDELTYAYDMDLIDKKLIEELIIQKPEPLELIITGRDPAPLFTDNADYISEIKAVKHPFDKGIPARRGIEY